jgi:hypothetical protein
VSDESPDQDGAVGCLAAGWFDCVLLAGAVAFAFPVASLASLGCPSGGPGCSPMLSVLILFAWSGGLALAFTVLCLGLGRLAGRWSIALVALLVVGLLLLAIPIVALARALIVGDTWLTSWATAIWLIVPGISILADVRATLGRRRSVGGGPSGAA